MQGRWCGKSATIGHKNQNNLMQRYVCSGSVAQGMAMLPEKVVANILSALPVAPPVSTARREKGEGSRNG